MDAGRLRDRITVQRLTQADDGYGNTVNGWANHLILWADVLETLGRERVAAGRIEAARTATIRIRASSDSKGITEADRVVCRGQVWNIRSIAAMGRSNALLEMLCETGVA